MPYYFLGTFTEYPYLIIGLPFTESGTNASSYFTTYLAVSKIIRLPSSSCADKTYCPEKIRTSKEISFLIIVYNLKIK